MTTQPAHPAEPSDARLLKLAKGGDHAALGTLLHRHEPRLFHIAVGLLRNREDALEATQEAYLAVVRSLHDFRGDATVSTWMTRIVINKAKDILRRRKRRPAAVFSALETQDGTPMTNQYIQTREPLPSAGVQDAEEHERLRDAIAGLDESFRTVLVLRDLDGMDYEQIGRTLELPLGTVKSRLFRARLMLRDALRGPSALPTPTSTGGTA